MDSSSSKLQVVLFPFMSKGHTIPILQLARLLLRRGRIAVTVLTTPANHPFVAGSLADTTASIIDLPFPKSIPEIPLGAESTDQLPSISLYPQFALATELMKPEFERAIEMLPRVSFMVSDGFLWWTAESARKFGFPRLISNGMCTYSSCVLRAMAENNALFAAASDDELVTLPQFPWIKVTKNDLEPALTDPESKGSLSEFVVNISMAEPLSYGHIMNSFYGLEPTFVDYWNRHNQQQKAWCVGPLCLAEPPKAKHEPKPEWIQWLDQKLHQRRSVLYVAFGTQAEISPQQLEEMARGLEESQVSFLWLMRKKDAEIGDGFEERVKGRGIIVREWVDQREILMHQSVRGFLSHVGWNSVLEGICAGVPILALPMMAEQHLNARMVVEEIKVGLKVETCDGSVRGFVKGEGLKKMVRELMEGEMGNDVREKAKELADMGKKAMEERAGSSWHTLDTLIDEICNKKKYQGMEACNLWF